MKQVLMCHPKYFNVKYDINPWMTSNINTVDNELAIQQWNTLYAYLKSCSFVNKVEPVEDCPDMVFTANAGFYFNPCNIILSNFKHIQRKQEEIVFQDWFLKNHYVVHKVSHFFEGQGDLLMDTDNLCYLGTGFRTDIKVQPEIENILQSYVHVLKLVDPRWYHLDTCFCPLPNGELLWYPNAFDETSQQLVRDIFSVTIDVSESDALQFACNSVCVLNNIFSPVISSKLSDKLKSLGYNHISVDLSEFLKSGGAARCLVMNL